MIAVICKKDSAGLWAHLLFTTIFHISDKLGFSRDVPNTLNYHIFETELSDRHTDS